MNEHGGLSRLNLVLLIVLVSLAAFNWRLESNSTERGLEFVPEMVRSIAAESFSANPVLSHGMTLQQPPDGTIARGLPPLRFVPTLEDALRAGADLQNSFSAEDSSALERGQAIFSRYCALCHGHAGLGDGTVAQRGFPTPPSLLGPNARAMLDGQMFHIITVGQGNMPGHAAQLDRADRWKAVLWIRELQSKTAVAPSAPEEITSPTTSSPTVALGEDVSTNSSSGELPGNQGQTLPQDLGANGVAP